MGENPNPIHWMSVDETLAQAESEQSQESRATSVTQEMKVDRNPSLLLLVPV